MLFTELHKSEYRNEKRAQGENGCQRKNDRRLPVKASDNLVQDIEAYEGATGAPEAYPEAELKVENSVDHIDDA